MKEQREQYHITISMKYTILKIQLFIFSQVIFSFLWSERFAQDIGTLFQLRCSIHRTNINGDVKHEMNEV